MQGPLYRVVLLGSVIVALAPMTAHAAEVMSMNRSHLSSESEDVQRKTLDEIRNMHVIWFRDGPSSGSTRGVTNFVNEVRLVKQHSLKMLVAILQMDEDYDGPLATNTCGWKEKKLSEINLSRYAQRLRTLFGGLKEAKLTIDAVEFGNEYDQYCFDADVPHGHAGNPTQQEVVTWLRGYGRFLKTGVEILHEPNYFPEAKIITFGLAHSGDYISDDSFPHPARMMAMLRNVDGFNYLENKEYKVDGYGTHLYPSPNNVNSVADLLHEDAASLGTNKSYWVTEWGFLNLNAFPNKKGQSVSEVLQDVLLKFDSLRPEIPLGPLMLYQYDVWLANNSPAAAVLITYASKR